MSSWPGLAGGDAPRAWRAHIERARKPATELFAAGRDVAALAEADIVLFPEPTFGVVVADLLAGPGPPHPAPEVDGGKPGRRQRRRADPPRPPRTAGSEKVREPARKGRPPAWRTEPPSPSETRLDRRSLERLAGGPKPAPDATAQVEAAAGLGRTDRPADPGSDARRGATAGPDPTVGSRNRSRQRPEQAEPGGDRGPVGREPRDGPDPRADMGGPSGWPRAERSGLDRHVERLADQLGATSLTAMVEALRSVPRPGPTGPISLLTRSEGNHGPGRGGSAVDRPTEVVGSAAVAPTGGHGPDRARPRPDGGRPGRGSAGQRDVGNHRGRDIGPDLSPAAERQTVSNPGKSQGSATPPDPAIVRHVTEHREQPAVPARPRSTAPLPRSADAPTQLDQGSGPGAVGDDLAHRMKQILDEAARRHGIEV